MQDKNWVDTAEEIFRSVFSAVERQNYSGLSKEIEDKIVHKVHSGLDDVSQKINANLNPKQGVKSQTKTEEWLNARNARKQEQAQSTELANPYPQYYASKPAGSFSGPACTALGTVGASTFGVGSLVLTLVGLATGSPWIWLADFISATAFGGSIATLVHGIKTNGLISRFRNYVRQIGNRQYCDIEQLAFVTGRKKKNVLQDLREMINKGYFLQGHLDNEGKTLITSDEVYQNYLDAEAARKQRELKENELIEIREIKYEEYPEEVRKVLNEGEQYIKKVREANDAIPGEVMSQKLDVLEDIMKRIFEQLKKDPASVDDLQKLMKYYLPTTAKLIEAYKELDGKPSYGEQNIANTKREIEETMDVINEAFGKIFDDMFQDAAWDISTEISTMKTLLAKEGLTGGRDFVIDK